MGNLISPHGWPPAAAESDQGCALLPGHGAAASILLPEDREPGLRGAGLGWGGPSGTRGIRAGERNGFPIRCTDLLSQGTLT